MLKLYIFFILGGILVLTGVFANTIGVAIGALAGLAAKKVIPVRWKDAIMKGIGLCSIYIGISGAFEGQNTLILVISMVLGTMIGEGIMLEERFNGFANRIENRFSSDDEGGFANGFITASLLMCIGAMSIVGAMNAGLRGDNTLLFTKTVMDGISAIMLAATMGIGVFFACVPILVLEGSTALLAGLVEPVLTDAVVSEMTCAGSIMIIAIGFNIVLGTKLKVLNFFPALFMPLLICPAYDYIAAMF